MTFQDCLIVERSDDWLIVVRDAVESVPLNASTNDLVGCVSRMIEQARGSQVNCVLAPASESCYFATIAVGDVIDSRDRAAMTYELEDHLPIDAEAMAADFVEIPSVADLPDRVAAVAVEADRWSEIANALEDLGVVVRSIVPSAVLATRAICRNRELPSEYELFLIGPTHCDAVMLRDQTMIRWKHLRLDESVLQRHRRLDSNESGKVVIAGADGGKDWTEILAEDAVILEEDLDSLMVGGAELYLASPSTRWFELRKDRLAPTDPLRPIQGHLQLVAVALATCLLALILGGWWRTQRIEREIADVRSQQQELFREAFPEARVPAALVRRVRSEHTRVMASRGASTDVDVPQSATEVLRQLLIGLPSDVRFRITGINIADGQVDLDLEVRSPVDAGALATSLSQAGFDVDPPVTTQKDASTFESVLEAKWQGQSDSRGTGKNTSIRISWIGEATG